ncbi:Putative uncharacterized transposon-derived protein F52C9.6 [Eumeta japonica]|uniref:Uncharacterized transposon-derived protein F52C9.6 n=1 Tax=Eumeta variegata TaxID=151549 RepID=A0A4C1V1B9_EUMVA|nr:Putative uncharacterized transposon-derived protein F52C9.6 [Eumeta japonica]
MESSILNLKRINKLRNSDIRRRTKIIDDLNHCKKLKWKWSGHVAHMSTDRWPNILTHWAGPNRKRKQGRPPGSITSKRQQEIRLGSKSQRQKTLEQNGGGLYSIKDA